MHNIFSVPPGQRRLRDSILWWESRRLYYNLFIACAGVLFCVIASMRMGEGDFRKNFLAQLAIYFFILQLPANFWYTGGWILEVLLRRVFGRDFRLFGPIMLVAGSIVSVVFVVFVLWVFRA